MGHSRISNLMPHKSRCSTKAAASHSSAFIRPEYLNGAAKQNQPAPTVCACTMAVSTHEMYDPYQFPSHISQQDLYLFSEGKLHQGYRMLGSHAVEINGVKGVRFAVWAPNAERVSVVGEFNQLGWSHSSRCVRMAPAEYGNCSFPRSSSTRCTAMRYATATPANC